MIYVVLGMHKSGTTLVSRLLHHAGINMVEASNTGNYDDGNFYERQKTNQLNLDMLGLKTMKILDFKAPSDLILLPEHQERMRRIIQEASSSHEDWGFKDPRTCLTYPLWASQMPEHRLIVIYRPVPDIWHRYRYNGKRIWLNVTRSIELVTRWCEHNCRIVATLQQTSCAHIILSYDELMGSDYEYQRLEQFLQRPLKDQRRPELYRGKISRPHGLIMFATLFVYLRYGYNYRKIWKQLDALRQTQIHA